MNQKLFYFFIVSANLRICQPTWELGDTEAFFAANNPLGLRESMGSAREWGNSSSVCDNGTGSTAQFCTWGTQDVPVLAHSDSWAPHLWAVLGSADPLARDSRPLNQLLPKFSVKRVCDCWDAYRQRRERCVLQSLRSEAITMSRGSVLGCAEQSPTMWDSTNKDCKPVLHCRKWTRAEKMSCRLNNPAGSFGSCKGV